MQEELAEVICDTSFLIHLATTRVKNIDHLDVEIGQIIFVVPAVVRDELSRLAKDPKKRQDIQSTLNYIKDFKTVPISGTFADKEILDHASGNRIVVATMDRGLKRRIKGKGGSIMSFSNDRIVLESQ